MKYPGVWRIILPMKMVNRKFSLLIIIFVGLFLHGTDEVEAEYNSSKLGEAFGYHIGATMYIAEFAKSDCGRFLGEGVGQLGDVEALMKKMLPYLSKTDRVWAAKRFRSKIYRNSLLKTWKSVLEKLSEGAKKHGNDEGFVCGMIFGWLVTEIQKGRKKWEYAKKHYSR